MLNGRRRKLSWNVERLMDPTIADRHPFALPVGTRAIITRLTRRWLNAAAINPIEAQRNS
jgi:hypothetical protein